ncbi:MAG: hypothetical protein K5873_04605 [Treponema sp.]|nr:hypothetical protein [Treponema sp.]
MLFLIIQSCASTPETLPDWFSDFRTVYPASQYIAQQGVGSSQEAARSDALSQIARYFQANVNTHITSSRQFAMNEGVTTEKRSLVNDLEVKSQVELFAIQYTNPLYIKKEKNWYCVAYINREEAWNLHQPKVELLKTEFMSLFLKAEEEKDHFLKYGLYKKAEEAGSPLLKALEYARVIDSQKEAVYSVERKTVSLLPARIASELNECSVYLEISGDYGNTIRTSLTSALSSKGIKVVNSENGANYIGKAQVESNALGENPITVYPSLDFKIDGKDGRSVYAASVKIEKKTIAYTLENAQKKSYPILAEESKRLISDELTKNFGL